MKQRRTSRQTKYILSPRPLGQGGQAEVFEARHRDTNNIVALKKVKYTDVESIARMRREIETQLNVNHKNIMPVLDYSASYRWYTMPLANSILINLPLPIEDNLLKQIIIQSIDGLNAAHAKGHIHRDLTPGNIMSLLDEKEERWVVSDWGLVRRKGITTVVRTLPGQGLGTAGFSAPEMWDDAHNVDIRADIYSLGRIVAWATNAVWPKPNIPLIPNGVWENFVRYTTMHEVDLRPHSLEETLFLLPVSNSDSIESSNTNISPYELNLYQTSDPSQTENSPVLSLSDEFLKSFETNTDIYQEQSQDKEFKLNSLEAKKEISSLSREIINTMKEKEFVRFANYIHPVKGVRLSPYSYVGKEDVLLSREEIENALKDNSIKKWGYYDGTGDPIELTVEQYFDKFVFSQDFTFSDRIGYNEFIGQGNTVNNALKVYPDSLFVEYYFIGFDPQFGGMDWESLRIAFELFEGSWYIVGLIHDCWTI